VIGLLAITGVLEIGQDHFFTGSMIFRRVTRPESRGVNRYICLELEGIYPPESVKREQEPSAFNVISLRKYKAASSIEAMHLKNLPFCSQPKEITEIIQFIVESDAEIIRWNVVPRSTEESDQALVMSLRSHLLRLKSALV